MDYKILANVYSELESTTKRLEKTDIIAKLLKETPSKNIDNVIYLLQGNVFPKWDQRKIGFSSQLVIKAIASAVGSSKETIIKNWKKIGDLGKVSEELISNKKQRTLVSKHLTVDKVFENIRKLSELEGKGTVDKKIGLIVELLSSATPLEAKYVTRTVLEDLRVGVAEGVLRDAIAKAYDTESKKVEKAYDILVDYAEVTKKAKEKKLEAISLSVSRPINVMLAIKVDTLPEAFEAVGKPALIEFKLDGFRVQIHKSNNEISLFTRRLENVTSQFAEVIPIIKKQIKGSSYIVDSEFVGYDPKTGKYLPFQSISQRIKRKYHIEKIAKEFPVVINVFDVINYEGKNLMDSPQEERRKLLEKIVKQKTKQIVLTKKLITSNEKQAEKFFKESLKAGNEGVMIKNLKGIYQPGRRVEGWVKYKEIMETLDLVIIEAEWGRGKRVNWFSSFTLGCKKGDKFVSVGKVGTGIKEKESDVTFKSLTKYLKPLIISEKNKIAKIKPKLVVEIAYEEIQKSPTYESGYALRFPRVIRIRWDRSVSSASSLQMVEKFYKSQKKK